MIFLGTTRRPRRFSLVSEARPFWRSGPYREGGVASGDSMSHGLVTLANGVKENIFRLPFPNLKFYPISSPTWYVVGLMASPIRTLDNGTFIFAKLTGSFEAVRIYLLVIFYWCSPFDIEEYWASMPEGTGYMNPEAVIGGLISLVLNIGAKDTFHFSRPTRDGTFFT